MEPKMKRVLIYNFSGELAEITHLFPSERLARIAAIAKDCGQSPTIIDRATFSGLEAFGADFMKHLGEMSYTDHDPVYDSRVQSEVDDLIALAPDLVFLNLWHGAGFKFSFDLARELRVRMPDLRIFGVGQKVDWFGKHILELEGQAFSGLIMGLGYAAVDSLCRGNPLPETPSLIYQAESGEITTGRHDLLNPDDYPAPLYDESVYHDIDHKIPVYTLILSNQACPNQCVYCIRPTNYGRVQQRREIAEVVREVKWLHENHGITHFRIEDSTPPPRALTELAEGLVASNLAGKVFFCAFSRVDSNGQENFELLHEAGFISLFFGIESLADEVLVRLSKGITVEEAGSTLERAHAAGIRTVGSFIFPTPRETETTMGLTLERIRELKGVLDSALVLAAGVYPPTPWGEAPEKYGIELADDYLERVIIYPVKYMLPLREWPPYPLTYDLMGHPASDVTFDDIVDVHERFVETIRNAFQIPGLPDYYFLLAHFLEKGALETAGEVVPLMMSRNYAGLAALFQGHSRA
jgi:radical SAM superfamily enzyme YgiQ (UPF0313 family)